MLARSSEKSTATNQCSPEAVVEAVRVALGGRKQAGLYDVPRLTPGQTRTLSRDMALEAVGYGPIVRFESAIAATVGDDIYAVAVSSGTAALHLALLGLGVQPGDWVMVPALTFAAAAAAVRYCGAYPIFYEAEEIDDRYALPVKIKAMIGVDLLGIPAQQHLALWAERNGIAYIEDAAQALGSSRGGTKACRFGKAAVLSFNNNKIVTCGGGGMVLSFFPEVIERARFLATTAKAPSPFFYDHPEIGFNYRMSALQASFGLLMLRRLSDAMESKARLHDAYRVAFRDVAGVEMVEAPSDVVWNHWLNAIEVPEDKRDAVLTRLQLAGYGCRALYTPLPRLAPYTGFVYSGQTFPEADYRFARTVCLPSGPGLA